jgi:hypothetical protein
MKTIYEYVVETLDYYDRCGDDPDIIDTHSWDKLGEAHKFALEGNKRWRIALRRDTWDEHDGLEDRWYVYPDHTGQLPSNFESCRGIRTGPDGPDVPLRYRNIKIPMYVGNAE